ncbi:MAG: OmpA family protein [Planctomycetota bacterium]|jgi:chemotaxis protein MotB
MKNLKHFFVFILVIYLLVISGCVSEQDYNNLKIQNNTQRKRVAELESELKATQLKLDKAQRQLDAMGSREGIEAETLQQKIAALEEDLAAKKELISVMQQRLLHGGMQLPVELSTKLEDFAKDKELVTFDSDKGVVKFKSDLLFEPGSDVVSSAPSVGVSELPPIEAIGALCKILNSKEATNFDIIIAGHTDDMPIGKPATRQKHPTNWHLSGHRAISVLNIMTKNNVTPERLSIRGFGEYRPVAPNKPNKKGNPQNRRVEIYIVPKGL